MDFDAILASMAMKTGNVLEKRSVSKRDFGNDVIKEERFRKKRKVKETDARMLKSCALHIWNPNVEYEMSDDLHFQALKDPKCEKMVQMQSPAMEIAKQKFVKSICLKIEQAKDELCLESLANSAFEIWKYTSNLMISDSKHSSLSSGLTEEFVKSGAALPMALQKSKEIERFAETLAQSLEPKQNSCAVRNATVKVRYKADQVFLTFAGTRVHASQDHIQKLSALYHFQQRHLSKLRIKISHLSLNDAIFCVLLRYTSSDGGGFQAALNEECFDVLEKHFDCRMECFASPLNCRYRRFCSAFFETDYVFGSVGSFFQFHPKNGCFEANPPFIPCLIERMGLHMTRLLASTTEALMFIVIVPAWEKTEGWKMLMQSKLNVKHLFLDQKSHGYCEGKQEIRKMRWRIASFHTSVFFWANEAGKERWKVSEEAISELLIAFRSKQNGACASGSV